MTASSRACVRNAAHHAEHHYVARGRGWSSGYPPALSPEVRRRSLLGRPLPDRQWFDRLCIALAIFAAAYFAVQLARPLFAA